MRHLAFLLAVFALGLGLAACQAPQNSVSQDPLIFGRGSKVADGSRSREAAAANSQVVLARNCVQCHANLGRWSESEFRTKKTKDGRNWIVAGELETSALYQRLRGVSASGNMPPSGSLTVDERATLATWILSLKPIPAPEPTPSLTPVTPPVPTLTPAEQRWKSVRALVDRHCAGCHDEMPLMTEADFLAQYFVAGNAEQSFFLHRLRGVSPNGDMPPSPRPALNSDEVGVLRDWVLGNEH